MANITQYIGARYVPKFFENSDGDAEWRSGVIYEPLTIVVYNSNSYTSKKPVPASVGNPSDNPDYWAPTGVYNSQVQQLSDDVDALELRVDDIEKELGTFALYVGNSYAIGTDVNTGNGIYNRTKDLFDDSYLTYAGGSGFVDYDGAHSTYLELVQNAVSNDDVDPDKVTHIVAISAMGDSRAYAASMNINSALAAFATYCRTTFPNLREIIVALAEIRAVPDLATNYQRYLYDAHHAFKEVCPKNGMHYIGWIGWPAMYDSSYTLADNYHPSTAGYELICQSFRDSWKGSMQYMPFKWSGVGVATIPQNMKVQFDACVHPDTPYLAIRFFATSAIPANYPACASGDAVEISLPAGAKGIPNVPGVSVWVQTNMNFAATGKWVMYRFELTNAGGSYAVRGITRFSLSGDKTELGASANVAVNAMIA